MQNHVFAVVAGLLGALVDPAGADLPVHCLRHQIVGTWQFTVGKPSPLRSGCGHKQPDIEEAQPARELVDGHGSHEIIVELLNPNVAKAADNTGTWTMVYDEGFEVRLGDHAFFAFSNFTFEAGADSGKHNVSHCSDTIVGWYGAKDRSEFGCYYGVKIGENSSTPTPGKSTTVTKGGSYDKPLDHKTQEAKVAALNKKINFLQLGWTARAMPQWNGQTMQDINGYAGIRRTTPMRELHKDMMKQQQRTQAPRPRSFLQRPEQAHGARSGKVPQTWDWSDVNGDDFLEPVMDQADCGSCYDASTMRMLSVRHKINLNATEAMPFSINFPLMCSEYNQGCKGGFGFLTTRWSQDVGLIPATCMRYNTKGSCSLECDLEKELKGQKRYRAANHRFVNSWYGNFGAGVENATKEEIYRGGPVVLSFEPTEDFMFYSDGIFKSGAKQFNPKGEWEKVDHAVLAVGFGEEDGQKYWKIQNSWGADWGEEGFFRIRRGADESGIESTPEAADVVEDEQNGKQVQALFEERAKRGL